MASSCSIASFFFLSFFFIASLLTHRLGVACFVVSNGAVLMAAKWYLVVIFLYLMFIVCFLILYERPVQGLYLFFFFFLPVF